MEENVDSIKERNSSEDGPLKKDQIDPYLTVHLRYYCFLL